MYRPDSRAHYKKNTDPTSREAAPVAPFKPPRTSGLISVPLSVPACYGSDPSQRVLGGRSQYSDEVGNRFAQENPDNGAASTSNSFSGRRHERYSNSSSSRSNSRSMTSSSQVKPSIWVKRSNETKSEPKYRPLDQTKHNAALEVATTRTNCEDYKTQARMNSGGPKTDDEETAARHGQRAHERSMSNYSEDKRKRERAERARRQQLAGPIQKEAQLQLGPSDQAAEKRRASEKLAIMVAERTATQADASIDLSDDNESITGVPTPAHNPFASTAEPRLRATEPSSSGKPNAFNSKASVANTFSERQPKASTSKALSIGKAKRINESYSTPPSSPVRMTTTKLKKKRKNALRPVEEVTVTSSPLVFPAKPEYDYNDLLAEHAEEAKLRKKLSDADMSDTSISDDPSPRKRKKKMRNRDELSPDPLLEGEEEEILDPTTLCPFCNGLMPSKPSKQLVSLKEFLLERPNIIPNPTKRNPFGHRLPVTETASFCRRHRWERTVIPEGKAIGWPTEIDWALLKRRITNKEIVDPLSEIIVSRRPSIFLDAARREWHAKGRKMKNILSEFGTSGVEVPGYYGLVGQEVMFEVLKLHFVSELGLLKAHNAAPLDVDAYIRRVLVPETGVEMIRRDLELDLEDPLGRKQAERVYHASREYGQALFSMTKEEKKAMLQEEKRELKRARLKEEEEAAEKKRRKAKRSQKKVEAQIQARSKENRARLRRGESVDLAPIQIAAPSSQSGSEASDGDLLPKPISYKVKKGRASGSVKVAKRVPRVALQRAQAKILDEADSDEVSVTPVRTKRIPAKAQKQANSSSGSTHQGKTPDVMVVDVSLSSSSSPSDSDSA